MRRNYFFSFAAVLMLLAGSVAVSAQVGPLTGQVVIQQADGTTVPAVGGMVDIYRTDISGKYQTKLDKNGKFIFAGLPFVGTYIIAASAPNARPDVLRGVKAGHDVDYKITLLPGDGSRLSETEAKSIGAGGSSSATGDAPKESAEDRKKREEAIAKSKEIAAANEKNSKINEIVGRTFKAGNDALKAHHYDEAIAQYDEGLAADAEQPALLTNKSVALRSRGVDRYNAALKVTDEATKKSGLEAAMQDFKDAAQAATKAVELIKAQTPPTDPAALKNFEANKYFALSSRAEAMRLLVSKVDQTQADAGVAAYQEYIDAETDATQKAKAQLALAKMLFDVSAYDKAMPAYQKILDSNPNDIEAMYGLGLTLVNVGYSENNKDKMQQGVNYLQSFADKAPENDSRKAEVKGIVDELKKSQNVTPQKTTTGRRRGQ